MINEENRLKQSKISSLLNFAEPRMSLQSFLPITPADLLGILREQSGNHQSPYDWPFLLNVYLMCVQIAMVTHGKTCQSELKWWMFVISTTSMTKKWHHWTSCVLVLALNVFILALVCEIMSRVPDGECIHMYCSV